MNNGYKVLVTGATGYVGGRLVPYLLEQGFEVRAASRSLQKLKSRPWSHHPKVELVVMDSRDKASVEHACEGCRAVFYLMHSMLPGEKNFETTEQEAARNVVQACEKARVSQIIYLGGLGESGEGLSKHLRSRMIVGEVLREGSVPVTILRAAMIMGSGSASFEILRYLVERLPVMITPKWLKTESQPIAVLNVITYLAGCLNLPETKGQTYDIGGPDILTYHDLMRLFAEEAKLPKRWIIPVPVLTPRLSSYWIHIVTPVPASIARPLAEGLKNPVVCQENRIRDLIPQELLPAREAIHRALESYRRNELITRWTDAGAIPPIESLYEGDAPWAGGTIFSDKRQTEIHAGANETWNVIKRVGGSNGWFFANGLWRLRGALDRVIGGVGLRRGRRDAENITVGDALDFWRVLDVCENERLLLHAEMKLPGSALLEFKIKKSDKAQSVTLHQNAFYRAKGLLGIIYWYLVAPFHHFIFQGMLNAIKKRAENSKHDK